VSAAGAGAASARAALPLNRATAAPPQRSMALIGPFELVIESSPPFVLGACFARFLPGPSSQVMSVALAQIAVSWDYTMQRLTCILNIVTRQSQFFRLDGQFPLRMPTLFIAFVKTWPPDFAAFEGRRSQSLSPGLIFLRTILVRAFMQ
jgi:hypothetical protein